MKELLSLLNSICTLSPELHQYLSEHLKTITVAKKEHILLAGNISRNIYFIKKGLVRCYYYEDGIEMNFKFMKEGDILVAAPSFFLQQHSQESVQAIEDTTLWFLSYEELHFCYNSYAEFNRLSNILTTRSYLLVEQRTRLIRMKQASQRYSFMLQHYPDLILRVPAKQMATYLCISEETLSRIRSRKNS